MQNILVVDDDPKMRTLLRRCLEGEGFAIHEASSESEVVAALSALTIALIALDLNLGAESGLAIARHVREVSKVPIIMITAKTDVIDRVVGLELGADDYITKPFHPRELVARVRAVLRRAARGTDAVPDRPDHAPEGSPLMFDGLKVYPDRHELYDRQGALVDLTSGDFLLLQVFLDHPKRILSRERIMDLLHGTAWAPFDRTIDNQVARLRRKIERDTARPLLIKTVRGVGYMFAADLERG
ncbi:MAG: response regulator [Pseudomonadota bacterium]